MKRFFKGITGRISLQGMLGTVMGGLKMTFAAAVLAGGLAAGSLPALAQSAADNSGYTAIDLSSKEVLKQTPLANTLVDNSLKQQKEPTLPAVIASRFIDPGKTLLIAQLGDDYFCGPAFGCRTFIYRQIDKTKNTWSQVFDNQGDQFWIQNANGQVTLAMRRNGLTTAHTSYWRLGDKGFTLIPDQQRAQTPAPKGGQG